ncbi:MAG: heavy-metal-associated domain-containing protein [Clostridiales bacterium]|nr:heavy-metal-associated domain-containing protein [Clostridiales bacterium]
MHCANCARRVENAFNKENGLLAKADTGQKKVSVWSKSQLGEPFVRKLVADAGYTMLSMREFK